MTTWTPAEIKDLRVKMGLSQQDYAVHLGSSVTTVSRWENGHQSPSRITRKLLDTIAERAD